MGRENVGEVGYLDWSYNGWVDVVIVILLHSLLMHTTWQVGAVLYFDPRDISRKLTNACPLVGKTVRRIGREVTLIRL